MIQTLSRPAERNVFRGFPTVFLGLLLLAALLYFQLQREALPAELFAVHTGSTGMAFTYEVTTSDVTADWAGGGDFDPRDKCPTDFFTDGFVVLCKKLADGAYFKFLYHRGKKLLYRIDRDVVDGQARIGLHWVESTKFGAKYRIADDAFRGGKTVQTPNVGGGTQPRTFHYGEAVSKKRSQPGRELFDPTHIDPDQCPEWWDIFNFIP